MKIWNSEESRYDDGGHAAPWKFYGNRTPDGDDKPFIDAPIMSEYTCVLSGSEALYVKVAAAHADADWQALARAGGTISGNLTVTGTVTAGDVVVSA